MTVNQLQVAEALNRCGDLCFVCFVGVLVFAGH